MDKVFYYSPFIHDIAWWCSTAGKWLQLTSQKQDLDFCPCRTFLTLWQIWLYRLLVNIINLSSFPNMGVDVLTRKRAPTRVRCLNPGLCPRRAEKNKQQDFVAAAARAGSKERRDWVWASPHSIRKRISPKSVSPLTAKASSTLLVHFRGVTCYM